MNISLKSDKASSFSKNIFRGTFSSIHQSAATVEICYFMHLALKDRNFSRLSIALPWKLICVSCNKIIRANSWFKSRGLSFALDQLVITDAAELQLMMIIGISRQLHITLARHTNYRGCQKLTSLMM